MDQLLEVVFPKRVVGRPLSKPSLLPGDSGSRGALACPRANRANVLLLATLRALMPKSESRSALAGLPSSGRTNTSHHCTLVTHHDRRRRSNCANRVVGQLEDGRIEQVVTPQEIS